MRDKGAGKRGRRGGVAVQWQCQFPDRDVTQVAGHRECGIEPGYLCLYSLASSRYTMILLVLPEPD